jgi:6-pyruvoyltetrahydropterin/6-carboxytetrahydropterin synthase
MTKTQNNYFIQVKVRFRMGHRLVEPYQGKCNNPHGEYITLIAKFKTNKLDSSGMVFDFSTIKDSIKTYVDRYLDHSYVHADRDEVGSILEKMGFRTYNLGTNPTSENLAEHLYNIIKNQICSEIYEVGIVESSEDNVAYYNEVIKK